MNNLTTIYLKDFLTLTLLSGGIFLLYNYFWSTEIYHYSSAVIILLVGFIYLFIINKNSTVAKIRLAKYFISLAFLPSITVFLVVYAISYSSILSYFGTLIIPVIASVIFVLAYPYATSFALEKNFLQFERKTWLKASIISNVLIILLLIANFIMFGIFQDNRHVVEYPIYIINFIIGMIITLILLRGFSKVAKNNNMTLKPYKSKVTILACGLLIINPISALFFWQPIVSALLVWSLNERKGKNQE